MLVMDSDNVEILVKIITWHPIEVGEQHTVAVVHIVEQVRIFINA